MSFDIKTNISKAIQGFSEGDLFENAVDLFNTLGYNTERQSRLHEPTFKSFKENFIQPGSRFDEEKAKSKEWKYVDLIFQLTKDEVLKMVSLFDTKQVDTTIIEGYLFFVIEFSKEQYSRTELSLITREVNRLFQMPAMILFSYGSKLTLSVINRRLHKRDENKDVLEKVTLIKDIDIARPHRAHIEILFDLSLDDLNSKYEFTNFVELHYAWQKTLDIKELNKKFFLELANWYFWATSQVVFPDDEIKEKETLNATSIIRLITRLMFVWFLKEKNLVPDDLFDENTIKKLLKFHDKKSSSYYKAILQNLFFATLNTEMGKRKFRSAADKSQSSHYFIHNLFRYENEFINPKETLKKYFDDIPFLNGGLFECLDKQVFENGKLKPVRIDGFSDREDNKLKVPDELFFSDKEKIIDLSGIYGSPKKKKEKVRGLIDILNSYKFTVAENTPVEEEVALDPELLGKVFENLLANYNPETKTTARKQTGSFYTPREIVNYMVDESLIAYLKGTFSFQSDSTVSFQSDSTVSFQADGIQADGIQTFFDPNNEIEIHKGNLPHWQQEGVWYFITFRLADSIPAEIVQQVKSERELWLKKHHHGKDKKFSKEELIEYYRLFSKRIEDLLDDCTGSCVLKNKRIAKIVADALLYFNNQRYILDEWVIMPNHVHVLVKPLSGYKLNDILHSWKSFTANEINKIVGKKGQLWMHESYDHIVRNSNAFEAIKNYIRNNPVKAKIQLPEIAQSWTYKGTGSSSIGSIHASASTTSSENIGSASKESNGSIHASGSTTSSANIGSASKESISSIHASGNIGSASKDACDTMLRDLLSYSEKEITFSVSEKEKLINAIDNAKILDPACGSGAFPMGILHKLVHLLHKIDPKNELWKQRQIEKASAIDDAPSRETAIDAIEEAFENNELDYGRKLYLIENCIYGVDIQPIAVQIAKLRFFISLIVDQKKNPAKENLGVRPLPNLETKFVAANTLIGLEKETNNLFTNPEIEKKKEELKKVRHRYFEARTPKTKTKFRELDKKYRDELADLLVENHSLQPVTSKMIANWNPYDQNASASFFDMEWMFGIKEGFDVVIGNPPYGIKFKTEEKVVMRKIFPESQFKIDSYSLFVLKSILLLTPNGYCSFIISNTLLDNYFEEKVREKLLKLTSIREINDLDDKVFDTVIVHTMVFSFSKNKLKNNLIKSNHSNNLFDGFQLIPQDFFMRQEKFTFSIREFDSEDLITKLKSNTLPLNKVIDLRQAIKTGNDGKFILNKAKKKNHKPILRGKDVFNWRISSQNLFVDYGDYLACPRDYKIFEQPKILIREAGSTITATYDENNFYIMSSLYNGILINRNFNLLYVLCLINSKLFQFLMNKQIFEKTKGAFTKAKIYHYERLPIKIIDTNSQNKLKNIATYILLLKKQSLDSFFFERLIDAMVYELYFPESIQSAGAEVLKHLNNLPELKDGDDKKNLKTIEKVLKELSHADHPVSKAMARMNDIEEVAIIEGKK